LALQAEYLLLQAYFLSLPIAFSALLPSAYLYTHPKYPMPAEAQQKKTV